MAHFQESLIILVASVTGQGGSVTLSGLDAATPYYLPTVTVGNTFYYSIPTDASGNWEYGLGTWTATGNGTTTFGTFARTSPIRSSGGAGVPAAFSGNPVSLLFDVPGEKSLFIGANNEIVNGEAIANAVNVLNFAALRDQTVGAINNTIFNVGYGRNEGDGLGGFFLLKLGDVSPADDIATDIDVNVIAPALGNARYARLRSAFQPPTVATVDNLPTGAVARLASSNGLITNNADRGSAVIPEVDTHFQGVYSTYAEYKAVPSSKWKDGDKFWFYGKLTAGDCRPHGFVWNASNTNTAELESLVLRPNDITGSNAGRAVRSEPGPILKFNNGQGAPSVIGSEFFRASDAGTTITALGDAIDLVPYVIFPGLVETTFAHSAGFVMPGEMDFPLRTAANGGAPVTIIYEDGIGYLTGGGGGAGEIASQEDAEAGIDNEKLMTPLRTFQAIDKRRRDRSRLVDIRDYDGVDLSAGASASALINQAIQDALTADFAGLYLTRGHYNIDAPIIIDGDDFELLGAGLRGDGTVLRVTADLGGNAMAIGKAAGSIGGLTIGNFFMQADVQQSAGAAMALLRTFFCNFHDIYIDGIFQSGAAQPFWNNGISVDGDTLGNRTTIERVNCSRGSGVGLLIGDSTAMRDLSVKKAYFAGWQQWGGLVRQSGDLTFDDVEFNGNGTAGNTGTGNFKLGPRSGQRSSNGIFTGLLVDNGLSYGLVVEADPGGEAWSNTFDKCWSGSNDDFGVVLGRSVKTKFTNGRLKGNEVGAILVNEEAQEWLIQSNEFSGNSNGAQYAAYNIRGMPNISNGRILDNDFAFGGTGISDPEPGLDILIPSGVSRNILMSGNKHPLQPIGPLTNTGANILLGAGVVSASIEMGANINASVQRTLQISATPATALDFSGCDGYYRVLIVEAGSPGSAASVGTIELYVVRNTAGGIDRIVEVSRSEANLTFSFANTTELQVTSTSGSPFVDVAFIHGQ